MAKKKAAKDKDECFVIMPISDPEGYEFGHFKSVYNEIIRPSAEEAGYRCTRADDVKQANLIHLDILERLVTAPMAICDLSSRNPNVLFELGIRQAFDKPVVLIQEEGTERIFDINPLRILPYRRTLRYSEVLADQETIKDGIEETKQAVEEGKGINSLIRLLSIQQAAKLPEKGELGLPEALGLLMGELQSLNNRLSNIETATNLKLPNAVRRRLERSSIPDGHEENLEAMRAELETLIRLGKRERAELILSSMSRLLKILSNEESRNRWSMAIGSLAAEVDSME